MLSKATLMGSVIAPAMRLDPANCSRWVIWETSIPERPGRSACERTRKLSARREKARPTGCSAPRSSVSMVRTLRTKSAPDWAGAVEADQKTGVAHARVSPHRTSRRTRCAPIRWPNNRKHLRSKSESLECTEEELAADGSSLPGRINHATSAPSAMRR